MIAFGPISSRRLGLSLGINNIVSHKICTYSCVYCQIGITKNKSMVRQHFYDPEKLSAEVESHLEKLDQEHRPDYLTFVPNGEPTLDINLGKEIRLLKRLDIPVAVITNSSLIHNPQVREDLMEADWVSVKVDAVAESIWEKINRPYKDIDFKMIIRGLKSFAAAFQGKLNTETMLIDGFNDETEQISEIAEFIAKLNPHTAYLSIPTRPPAVRTINAVSELKMTEAWHVFQEAGISTELLTGFEGTDTGFTGNAFEDILNITAVHPLREDTMEELLRQDKTDGDVIDSLISQGLIKSINHGGKTYFIRSYHF